MASLNDLPGVCEVAMQGGLHAANTIKRRLKGGDSVPFKYRDLGSAGGDRPLQGDREREGPAPQRVPRFHRLDVVHLAFLSGFGHRFTTLLRWARAMVGRARPERVFSVGHTGGDLSLPDEVKAKVMPKPFPVLEDQVGWADLVGWVGAPEAGNSGATGNKSPSRPTAEHTGAVANYIRRMILDRFLVTDQAAVVTASGHGIGAATAVALAEAGADVVLAARTEDQLRGWPTR